jgi:hypothetical protein
MVLNIVFCAKVIKIGVFVRLYMRKGFALVYCFARSSAYAGKFSGYKSTHLFSVFY